MKQSFFLISLLSLSLFVSSCGNSVAPPEPIAPLPTQKQLDWHELEFYGFIHFSLNTFTNKEWGYGNESPELFNPTELDARQWARVAKEAGMKGIILTAKHHDGFTLWPSKYTNHSVAQSPWKDGKGDVVRELAEACREYGLKLGLYLSPWDRNHPEYGRPEYVTYFRNQLKELLTNYGDVFEMWFDGANGGSGYYGGANETRKINTLEYYDWAETYRMIYEISPDTLVWGIGPSEARWVGNEEGHANKTNWSPLRQQDDLAGKVHYKEYMSGHEDGEKWVPAEADVSIRPGWFYHAVEDDRVRSLEELVDIYYWSIGRNATLLLNLPVDPRGLIHENDEIRLKELTAVIKEDFKQELLSGSSTTADNIRGDSKHYAPQNVLDGNGETYWTTDDGVIQASVTFDFDQPTSLNRVLLQEYIALGQRVQRFTVEANINGDWQVIADETTIGYKRILRTERVTATALRVNIINAKASPVIANIAAYNAPTLVRMPAIKRNKNGQVTLTAAAGRDIYYSLDGSEPSAASSKYSEPFLAEKAVTIKAIARHREEKRNSAITTTKYGIAKASWKVIAVNGSPLNKTNSKHTDRIVDGDPRSTWSSAKGSEVPHSIDIDMGASLNIKGFTYMPKQVGNGLDLIASYEFYTSTNGQDWIKQSEGEFSNIKHNPVLQTKTFDQVSARYLRFVALSEVEGGKKVSIGEIGVVE